MQFLFKFQLTIICFVVGLSITVFTHQQFSVEEADLIDQSLALQTHKVERAIKQSITGQVFTYNWLATQWLNFGRPTADSWNTQVLQITNSQKFVKTILWINPNNVIKWVEPFQTNEHYLGIDLKQYPEIAMTLDASRLYGKQTSSNFPIKHNEDYLHLITPIGIHNQNQGFIDSVIDPEKFLLKIVRNTIDDGYQLNIINTKTEHEILQFYGSKPDKAAHLKSATVTIFQHEWQINIWPTEYKLNQLKRKTSQTILFGGILISFLVSFVTYLLTKSRHQAKQVIQTNIELQKEITERVKVEESLAFMVEYDNLTKLFNRSAIERHITQSLSQNADSNDQEVNKIKRVLILLDLDNFREVNNVLGHNTGDKLILKVAQRINHLLPKDNSFLARVGGDEFAVYLDGLISDDAIEVYANRILKGVDSRFVLDGYELYLSGSMGIAVIDEHSMCYTDLYRNADSALNQAKIKGKNCIEYYDPHASEDITERLELLKKLRKAIERQEFILYYQPKVDVHNGKCIGAEALIRWIDPELGLIPPDKFIPIAEDTGLIVQIGEWVLDEACQQLARWHKLGFDNLSIAINLSGRQLQQPELIEQVIHAQVKNQLSATDIELELTEQVFIENIDASKEFMRLIREKGFSLSIDDFGVGYSSLSYLKHFPVNTLKIDRSFIKNIPDDIDDVNLVKTIINLAQNMDLKIVAEGIENIQQLEFLASHGCQIAQGFFFSKPIPGEEFTKFLLSMHGNFAPSIMGE
ncbi:putative bifunctional diguanylate cyclase/phosphodiesterase [Algibacillus agarilyticus]|uniref:putative bifunctional diguanylate cyclase/phosphodiesterase n=1 Tax=Algibacillus agarilyticus TaxID=2234133 RepID=UPI000DCFE73F|nr:EAL domain-containing protein [Algibacillus agarilyticus]